MAFAVEGSPAEVFVAAAWPVGTRQWHTIPTAMDEAIGLCRQRRTAVQAGGCVGIFAQYLSRWFEKVVTFEPSPDNQACMVRNIKAQNVAIVPCGLSDRYEMCGLARVDGNPGATQMVAGKDVFTHPLDAMGLYDLDFLQLDVEGYELKALRGAEATIRRSWPVVMVELKGLGERVGDPDDAVVAWLTGLGYRAAGQRNRDHWYTHG
jgi:FkbM family methyltransferase